MKSWQVYESMSRNKYAKAAHPEKHNIKGSWLCRKQSLQPKRDVCTGRGMNRILSQVHFTNKFVQEIQNLIPLPKTGTDSWTRPSINQAPPRTGTVATSISAPPFHSAVSNRLWLHGCSTQTLSSGPDDPDVDKPKQRLLENDVEQYLVN